MDDPHVRSLLRMEGVELGITYPVGYELIRTDIGDAEAQRLLELPNSVGILEIWQAYFGAYGELVLVQRSCLVPGDSIRNPRHLRWEWEARRKGFLVHNPFQQDGGVNLPRLDGRTQS